MMRLPRSRVRSRRGRTTAWVGVVIAATLEAVWALALSNAQGLTRPAWLVVGLGIAGVSLVLLALALHHLPLGSAYAAWIGLGATGVVLAGVAFNGDALTPGRAVCLGLIVLGVIGLAVTDGPVERRRESLG